MAYIRYYQHAGDPFLGKLVGGLAKGLGAVTKIPILGSAVKMLPGVGTIAGIAGMVGGGAKMLKGLKGARAVSNLPAIRYPSLPMLPGKASSGLGRMIGAGVGGAAAGAGIGALLGGGEGGVVGGRRYRRQNVCNMRALRRAMRRVEGFSKLAKKTIRFTSTTKLRRRRKR